MDAVLIRQDVNCETNCDLSVRPLKESSIPLMSGDLEPIDEEEFERDSIEDSTNASNDNVVDLRQEQTGIRESNDTIQARVRRCVVLKQMLRHNQGLKDLEKDFLLSPVKESEDQVVDKEKYFGLS